MGEVEPLVAETELAGREVIVVPGVGSQARLPVGDRDAHTARNGRRAVVDVLQIPEDQVPAGVLRHPLVAAEAAGEVGRRVREGVERADVGVRRAVVGGDLGIPVVGGEDGVALAADVRLVDAAAVAGGRRQGRVADEGERARCLRRIEEIVRGRGGAGRGNHDPVDDDRRRRLRLFSLFQVHRRRSRRTAVDRPLGGMCRHAFEGDRPLGRREGADGDPRASRRNRLRGEPRAGSRQGQDGDQEGRENPVDGQSCTSRCVSMTVGECVGVRWWTLPRVWAREQSLRFLHFRTGYL